MDGVCPFDPSACVEVVLNGALQQLVDLMLESLEWVVQVAFGWWIGVDSVVPSVVNTPVRGQVAWLTLALTVLGLTVAGIRIMVARRGEPILDAVRGLVTVAMVSAVGVVTVATLVRAGDRWSAQLMADGVDGVGDEIATALMLSNAQPGVVLLLGVIVFVLGIAQAGLMLFREGAILLLTGMLPLAAAGQLVGFGRQWLTKVVGWLLALVLYKPVAALTYFAVFQGLNVADSGREVLVAVVMLGLSVVALPAMMRLFSWTTDQAGGMSSPGGGSGLLAAGAGAAVMAAASRPSSYGAAPESTTVSRSDAINRSLGPADGSGARPVGAATVAGAGAGGSRFAAMGATRAHVAVAAVDVAAKAGAAVRDAAGEAMSERPER